MPVPGLEDVDVGHVERLAQQAAVLCAGDVMPLLPGADAFISNLETERVEDLELAEVLGWP